MRETLSKQYKRVMDTQRKAEQLRTAMGRQKHENAVLRLRLQAAESRLGELGHVGDLANTIGPLTQDMGLSSSLPTEPKAPLPADLRAVPQALAQSAGRRPPIRADGGSARSKWTDGFDHGMDTAAAPSDPRVELQRERLLRIAAEEERSKVCAERDAARIERDAARAQCDAAHAECERLRAAAATTTVGERGERASAASSKPAAPPVPSDAAAAKEAKKQAIAAAVEELLVAAKARAAELPKDASRPKTVVVTGGPGVGKTTLLEHIQARLGCPVVPEAAIQAIGTLNTVLGKDGQKAWRGANVVAFGDMVGRVAMAQEATAATETATSIMFFDRTVLDNLGYSLERGYALPGYLDAAAAAAALARIDHVLVLDQVASAEEIERRNAETGRKTDPVASVAMSAALESVYSRLGCHVERIGKGSVEERAAELFAKCGIAPDAVASGREGPATLPPAATPQREARDGGSPQLEVISAAIAAARGVVEEQRDEPVEMSGDESELAATAPWQEAPEDEDDENTDRWSAVTWVLGMGLHTELANLLMRPLDEVSTRWRPALTAAEHAAAQLAYLRHLGQERRSLEWAAALLRDAPATIGGRVAQGASELGTEFASVGELSVKFQELDDFHLVDVATFNAGLEQCVGTPNPDLHETMVREHTRMPDAQSWFVTSNYSTHTTSCIEWYFVVDPAGGKKILRRHTYPSESGIALRKRRFERSLESFEIPVADKNSQLRAINKEPLRQVEVIGARLYTVRAGRGAGRPPRPTPHAPRPTPHAPQGGRSPPRSSPSPLPGATPRLACGTPHALLASASGRHAPTRVPRRARLPRRVRCTKSTTR